MPRRLGSGASVLLVVAVGVVAGGVTYLVERIFCSLAPAFPVLGESCDLDPTVVAVTVGLGVGVISLLGWLRKRASEDDHQ